MKRSWVARRGATSCHRTGGVVVLDNPGGVGYTRSPFEKGQIYARKRLLHKRKRLRRRRVTEAFRQAGPGPFRRTGTRVWSGAMSPAASQRETGLDQG